MSEFLPHVYGQEKVKKELSRLLEEDRLPHTLIFYGDEGLGKTTAALDLAAALAGTGENLPAAVEAVPEEEWRKMPALTLAGERVWYLYPQGMELKIEQFRVFLAAMASFDEKPHVCIIDEAQTMMEPVANSLLKTLEEPEGNIHFILITHDLDALLPTIVSRGERFGFYPLSRKDYHDLISAYPKKFTFPRGIEEDDLFQMSEGNPGITLEVCDEKGSAQPGSAMDFWEIMTDGVAPFARESTVVFKDRKDFLKMIRWISLVGRDIMVLAETGDSSLVRCRAIAAREAAVAPRWGEGRGEEAVKVLKTAETAVSRYINIKNVWDMVLIELEKLQKGEKTWNR